MLPTTGFFKNIDCPYYENSCDRPYCHFKHRKKNPEPAEPTTTLVPTEIPTYNPTPKSQLANARSHIPISYVPDLAMRTSERNNFRSLSSFGCSDKQPTYNPTPLSILSTGKANNLKPENKQSALSFNNYANPASCGKTTLNAETAKYSPTPFHEDSNDANINFEDLETEFDMIDEIISDSGTAEAANDESESTEDEKQLQNTLLKPEEPIKSKHRSNSSGSKSKLENKKHNGKVKEAKSKPKADAQSKSGSHSSKKEAEKPESKHKSSSKSSKSSKDKDGRKEDRRKTEKSEDKQKLSKTKTKEKRESKERHSSGRHSESVGEKNKHKHKSKPKERDKGKEIRSSDDKKNKVQGASSGIKKEERKSKRDAKVRRIKEESDDAVTSKLNTSEDCDMSDGYEDTEHYLNDSDFDEDPLQECFKIFNEYKPTEPHIFTDEAEKPEPSISELTTVTLGKKRIAHDNADKTKMKVMFTKPKTAISSAAQMMVNRYKAARLTQAYNEQNNIMAEIHREVLKRPADNTVDNKMQQKLPKITKAVPDNKSVKPSTSTTLVDDIISGKSTNAKPRRIAPVQNVNSIQRAKAKIEEMAKMRAVNALTKTTSQSMAKGSKRVAHVPEFSIADVPEVLEAERSKLPVNVRSRYLSMVFDECMKLYLCKEEAQQRAVSEEYKCYERCSALVTYRNSAMLAINRLRKELQEREMSGLGPIFPGESTKVEDVENNLTGRKFYDHIKKYALTDDELVLHGYPREGEIPGQAVIKIQKKVPKAHLDEYDRVCSRCSKIYRVDKDGFAVLEEECLYHPLKKRTFRGESIYLCCKSSEDTGCVTSATHVCERVNLNEAEVDGYQTTMPPEYEDDPRSIEVFALDCEMCYTTKGLELTRVTIVNADCKTVYESLVKPLNPIIDYNTRFSGITEEQMNRTATSILQVQANILHLCNSRTILIGHSLESDMKALKIIHSSIIDTSVMFPHKFGLPHKRALRDLAREYLKKIIQNDISGHDSAEDALTCMELVRWKVREDFKARGIKA